MNRHKRFAPQAAAGLSLVELMVSIALAAIILAGVVKLYADSHRSYLFNEGVARTQEGIRYVLGHISRSAAKAGYMGCTQVDAPTGSDAPNVENLINVGAGGGRRYDFSKGPVFGTDGGANGSDTLILRASKASEGIRISRINPVTVHSDDLTKFENSGLASGDVVVLSDCKKIRVFMMTNNASNSGLINHAAATPVKGISNLRSTFLGYNISDESQGSVISLFPATESSVEYSIGNSTAGTCNAANPQFCALFANDQELLQGVEDLQVLYGERLDAKVRYRTAGAVINWQNVASVQLTITLNSADHSFTNQADGLVRKTVTRVVALRNGDL